MKSYFTRSLRLILIVMVAAPLLVGNATTSRAQTDSRLFPETGKTVKGKFLAYWNNSGALAQQGFPISEEMSEQSETDGKIYTVQYFERAVFELHPEFAGTANEILLSLLGVFFYTKKYPAGAPNQVASLEAGAQLFPQTGKKLGGTFKRYWETHGGLRQQGFPISDEFIEVNELDGKPYKVQYFERAVFEFHPEFAGSPNEVLLSQLGTFRYRVKYQATPTPTPPPGVPTATRTATPAPPTATPIPEDPCAGIPPNVNQTVTPRCGRPGTQFTFVGIGFTPFEMVGVYATDPDGAVFGAPFQIQADSTGQAGPVTFYSYRGITLGLWVTTMEGISSKARSLGYFKIYDVVTPSPTPSPTRTPRPAGTPPPCDTSGTVNGSASPSSGRVGDTITLRATGFTPGEDVSFWFTLPDGTVLGTPEPYPGLINPDGSIGPLPLDIDEFFLELGEGRWAITFQGDSSQNVAIIYFCVYP